MRRFLTLVCLLFLVAPAGISISGCFRNPGATTCNGLGYGLKVTDVATITLEPRTYGISLFYGKTQQLATPSAATCKGDSATVNSYTYGTTNNQLVDVSPSGNLCAGTWNRNTGGGIGDYTICTAPNPLPSTNGLPYSVAYVTAAGNSVTSNPVKVTVHPQTTSMALVVTDTAGNVANGCFSQTKMGQLDAQACYSATVNGVAQNALLCAPSAVTSSSTAALACPLPPGVARTSIPVCSDALGTLSYSAATSSVASINSQTNQITANLPGTTMISATIAGSASSAGYFSTCAPASIAVTLADGSTNGTITKGVTQNLVTTVKDTTGATITGLSLEYQTTNQQDITASSTGAITTSFPGKASIFAVCQPPNCNPAPIQVFGLNSTGLPLSSNPVQVTTPGTSSSYLWFSAPGKSQYFVPMELRTGVLGSTVRLPYVPNSMLMDQQGSNLYFGSARELMIYSTVNNGLTKEDTTVPGVVLAVSPDNSTLLVNDQSRQIFYLYKTEGNTIIQSYGGLGNAAAWTPDSKTLYVTDNAALNNGTTITGHTDTLYVYNANTGWTTYALPASTLPAGSQIAANLAANVGVSVTQQTPALTVPGVGAYLRGDVTKAHTWCPTGTVGNYSSMVFYPEADSIPTRSDVVATSSDGKHLLGATVNSGSIMLNDTGTTIPSTACTVQTTGSGSSLVQTLQPLLLTHQSPVPVSFTKVTGATAINQLLVSPAVTNLAFLTYTGTATTGGASLPYYVPGAAGAAGTVGYVSLTGTAVSTPVAGVFSPDDKSIFVSTTGDNLIHLIDLSTGTPADSKQYEPKLPACTTSDVGCANPSGSTVVPATAITIKPRATT